MLAIFLLLPLFRVLPGFRSRGTVQTFPTICFLEDSVRAVQIQPFDGIPMQVTMNYLVSGCWQSQPVSEHSPLAEAKKDVLAILQDPLGIQVRNSNADTFRYWTSLERFDPEPGSHLLEHSDEIFDRRSVARGPLAKFACGPLQPFGGPS